MATPTSVLLVELVMSIDRLIESAKKAQIKPNQWLPQVALGHVAQVDEQVWLPRVKLMVQAQANQEPEPTFTWWEPDAKTTEELFTQKSLEDVAAQAMQERTKLVTYLRNLTPQQWQARATHATFGSIAIGELIFQTLSHDEEHRATFV